MHPKVIWLVVHSLASQTCVARERMYIARAEMKGEANVLLVYLDRFLCAECWQYQSDCSIV